ncbi:M23 family metallopeptidase [Aquimarina sp. D1M17]|nr:M23 family metallopeptidase [Aquimarina acroporae]
MNNVWYTKTTENLYMNFTQIILLLLLITACSNDDDSLDPTPPIFSESPIPLDQVSSFIPFGEELSATQQNPAIEYFLNQEAPVVSVTSGFITEIRLNTNVDDYEVWIKTSENSEWLIIYDHILQLEVAIGDQIMPGQILGSTGVGHRVELQINTMANDQDIAHCPLDFGTSDFISQHNNISAGWCIEQTVVP